MSVSRVILQKVRARLKIKGIPYRELAEKMGVAESTVKRWFSSENLSLNQLDQICDALSISLDDLVKTDGDRGQRDEFTPKQEAFFIENEKALVVFYLLSSGVTFKKILAHYSFKESELNRLLLQLDKNELIELQPSGAIRLVKEIGSWWDPKGGLSQKYYGLIKSDFISSDFSRAREQQWFFTGRLTLSSQNVITKKLNLLATEIRELYRVDRDDKDAANVTLFCGVRPWIFPLIKQYRSK